MWSGDCSEVANWAETFIIVAVIASWPRREGVTEHGQPARGFGGGGLVLQDIPVLSEQAILDADDVDGDPVGRQPGIGEPTVQHHVVAVGDGQRVLVAHLRW